MTGNSPLATEARKAAFLAHLAIVGNIQLACDEAGISRAAQLAWRNDGTTDETAEAFTERFNEALERFKGSLVKAAVQRGRDGVEEPVVFQGKLAYKYCPTTGEVLRNPDGTPQILTISKFSDRLLERTLEANDPSFRNKGSLEVSGPGGGAIPTKIIVEYVESNGNGRPREEEPDALDL